jgi:hypothetical protein
MNLSSSTTNATTATKTNLIPNTSLSNIKFNNTPNVKRFFASKVDKSVWWHTQQRKVNGQYISNPNKKWKVRKKSLQPSSSRRDDNGTDGQKKSSKFKTLKIKINNNNKVPQRPKNVNNNSFVPRKRPTPIRRKFKQNISPSNTLSSVNSNNSINSFDLSDDSEDENQFKALEASTIAEKYFKSNEKLTYVMEKMVSELSAKVVTERQKNVKRLRGDDNKNGKKKKSNTRRANGTNGNAETADFVQLAMAGINTTLEQDDIIDTRYGLKTESKKIIAVVEQENSALSLQVNKLLTLGEKKKQKLSRLEISYRNTESKIAVLIASLSIIEEKKKKLYAKRDLMATNLSRVLAYQQTLEHILKREKIQRVESKKKSMAISQKIKAVRRHYNSLHELGLEAKNMRNEVKLELDKLREQSREQIHKLNEELEKDTKQSKKIIDIQDNLVKRANRRKLIAAGHEFDALQQQIDSNNKKRNDGVFGSIFLDNPNAVQIRYGNRYFRFKELEGMLKKIHRAHNFSSGEVSPEAWLIDIYRQEQTKDELESTIVKQEKSIKNKKAELQELKEKALAISVESNNNILNSQDENKQSPNNDKYDTTQLQQNEQSESPRLLSIDEASRSSTTFGKVEQHLQDKIREIKVELDTRKNLVEFFKILMQKVKIGISSLQSKVARSDLPIPNHRAMIRADNLSPVGQMGLFCEAIISIENEIRNITTGKNALYCPKLQEGHLIYDEKIHEKTDIGRYNSRVNRYLSAEEDVATKDDIIVEQTLVAVNRSKRSEIKKNTRKALRIHEKKQKKAQQSRSPPRSPKKKLKL